MTDTDTDMEDARRRREEKDPRSDLQQEVEARSDAVERGDGGLEPETMTDPGMPDGVGGTGGVTKNQGDDAQ